MYCENIMNFLLLLFILLSGSEQAERDPCCRQGYWHKDRGWVGGLHGRDWHFGLLQPPSYCQTAGRLLFWRQTLGKRANRLTERNVLFPHMVLLMWSQGDTEAVNLESRIVTHKFITRQYDSIVYCIVMLFLKDLCCSRIIAVLFFLSQLKSLKPIMLHSPRFGLHVLLQDCLTSHVEKMHFMD